MNKSTPKQWFHAKTMV